MTNFYHTYNYLQDSNNHDSWSSWNPKQLKQRKSEKLKKNVKPIVEKNSKKPEDTLSEGKMQLLKAQRIFFENEDKRAEEKHEWEKEHARIKLLVLNMELQKVQKEMEH